MSATHNNFSLPFLVTPSVSPVYMNNPGYTTLSIKDNKISENPKVNSLQLIYNILFNVKLWSTMDPNQEFGIDFNNPSSFRNYFSFIQTPQEFGNLLAHEYGYDKKFAELVISEILIPAYIKLKDEKYMVKTLCDMMFYELDNDTELADCVAYNQK